MIEWLERRLKSSYLRMLEEEVKRLRDENRAIVNSLLGSHGMQQIDGPRSTKPMTPLKRLSIMDYLRNKEREFRRPAVVTPEEKPNVS
jgi:hypothetical protein